MIDLARLERTYSEVFDGPGTERLKLLGSDEIQAIPPDEWPSARLIPVPCLRLLALRYPVQEYATGVRKKEDPPLPDPRPTWLAVSRINYVVRRWTLSRSSTNCWIADFRHDCRRSDRESRRAPRPRAARTSMDWPTISAIWFQEWSAAGFFQTIDRIVK